ncbi:MAG: 4Fe-4S dicluster domain-containing protein [Deltaproteobacteria bacterium]|nr:4Fe-4S dicluster domain-containing protein [Deltaproteobacteria bacterium]
MDERSPITLPCTRRQILLWGGASLAGFSVLAPAMVRGEEKPLIIMAQARGMLAADPVLCVGCGRCELACTEFNDGQAAPSRARIRIGRNLNHGPQGTPSWRQGQGNMGDGLIVQDLCKQCPHPVPCANICPEGAIILSPVTGARMVDPERCTGCRICLRACPWEMIAFDSERRKATKCHLCQGKPKCVEACPSGALHYVAWRDLTGVAPWRNPSPAALPPGRALSCQPCHLPGQRENIRQTGAALWGRLRGRRVGPVPALGFRWVDFAGAILVPLAVGSVIVHAVWRKVFKR